MASVSAFHPSLSYLFLLSATPRGRRRRAASPSRPHSITRKITVSTSRGVKSQKKTLRPPDVWLMMHASSAVLLLLPMMVFAIGFGPGPGPVAIALLSLGQHDVNGFASYGFGVPRRRTVFRRPIGGATGVNHRPLVSSLGLGEGPMEDYPLNEMFQKAVVLQRSGDREGALAEYTRFLRVAISNDVDPELFAEVYANVGAIYAMQSKGEADKEARANLREQAKDAFQEAVKYRPSLGSAWCNLALLLLAEGKDMGGDADPSSVIKEARSCCERALAIDNDVEQSRELAYRLIRDIDNLTKGR